MKTQRGFTLIELMVTVGVGAILSTTFFTIMSWQSTQYYTQLDMMDAHQNGRAALNIMKRYVRSARYGLAENANAQGTFPIGMCYNDTGLPIATQSQALCHHPPTDLNNDRMRIMFLNNDPYFVTNPNYQVNGKCSGINNTSTIATTIDTALNPNTPIAFPIGTLAGVGGQDSSGNWYNDIVYITGDGGSGDSCLHRYVFTQMETGLTTLAGTYAPASISNSGWNFGTATVADFFIYQDNGTPELRLRTDPHTSLANSMIVAFDIESLSIKYGIDTTAVPDHRVDAWCYDLRTSGTDGGDGTCQLYDSNGVLLTTKQHYNRIIAVQITIGVRTDQYRKGLAGSSDGYHHYTYSTTVALRNDPSS